MTATSAITNAVLALVDAAEKPIAPNTIIKTLTARMPATAADIKTALAVLIRQGVLAYGVACGRNVMLRSFNQPVRISPHIVIKPSACSYKATRQDTVVNIDAGAAFGEGRHPTTGLALHALDDLFYQHLLSPRHQTGQALDLGTGSGILGLAALKMGMTRAVGVDQEAIACHEARQNARLNHLADQFTVLKLDLNQPAARAQLAADYGGGFELIVANLRWPTLFRLQSELQGLLRPGGGLVFSGLKTEDLEDLHSSCPPSLSPVKEYHEKGWAAASFLKAASQL